MPELTPARPCHIQKSEIQAFAEKVARSLGYEPGDSLVPIVNRLGGKIQFFGYDEFSEESDASIEILEPNDFYIKLSRHTSTLRDRFSIAHELGHYFLHYPLIRAPMKALRGKSNRVEWEANWFAAAFLMPQSIVEQLSIGEQVKIEQLSLACDVSKLAAKVRATDLGFEAV